MFLNELSDEVKSVARARLRRDLAELDFRRGVRRLADSGFALEQISLWVSLMDEEIEEVLRASEKDLKPLEGFSGATPDEICRRYAVGLIDREQLVDELVRYPYAPMKLTDGYDTMVVDPPGCWSEVSYARRHGYIEKDIYGEVLMLLDDSDG